MKIVKRIVLQKISGCVRITQKLLDGRSEVGSEVGIEVRSEVRSTQ